MKSFFGGGKHDKKKEHVSAPIRTTGAASANEAFVGSCDAQLDAEFGVFVDNLSLPPDKREQMMAYPADTKKMLLRQASTQRKQSLAAENPSQLIDTVNRTTGDARTTALVHLRVQLDTQPLSWLNDFVRADGVPFLFLLLSSMEGQAYNDPNAASVLFESMRCIKAVMNTRAGFEVITGSAPGDVRVWACTILFALVADPVDHLSAVQKTQLYIVAFEIVTCLCLAPGEGCHEHVLYAIDRFQETNGGVSFAGWCISVLQAHLQQLHLVAAGLACINTIVCASDTLSVRLGLRSAFQMQGLTQFVQKLTRVHKELTSPCEEKSQNPDLQKIKAQLRIMDEEEGTDFKQLTCDSDDSAVRLETVMESVAMMVTSTCLSGPLGGSLDVLSRQSMSVRAGQGKNMSTALSKVARKLKEADASGKRNTKRANRMSVAAVELMDWEEPEGYQQSPASVGIDARGDTKMAAELEKVSRQLEEMKKLKADIEMDLAAFQLENNLLRSKLTEVGISADFDEVAVGLGPDDNVLDVAAPTQDSMASLQGMRVGATGGGSGGAGGGAVATQVTSSHTSAIPMAPTDDDDFVDVIPEDDDEPVVVNVSDVSAASIAAPAALSSQETTKNEPPPMKSLPTAPVTTKSDSREYPDISLVPIEAVQVGGGGLGGGAGGPPPPPPPPGMGGPPPPPMPGMGGPPPPPGMVAGPPDVKPNVPMRALHWSKIPPAKTQGDTFWAAAAKCAPKLRDIKPAEVEDLFCQKKKDAKKAVALKLSTAVSLLEPKRSNNVSIGLSAFKGMSLEAITEAVIKLDDSVINAEQIEALTQILPNEEEKEMLRDYQGPPEQLAKAEQFMLLFLDIPYPIDRLMSWLYKLSFGSKRAEIVELGNKFLAACDAFRNSNLLPKVFGVSLAVGNYINGGTNRGRASGFKLDSLSRLVDMKRNDNRGNLLHFIASLVFEQEKALGKEELAELSSELEGVNECIEVTVPVIENLRSELAAGLDVFKSTLENIVACSTAESSATAQTSGKHFGEMGTRFAAVAAQKLEEMRVLLKNCSTSYSNLCIFFGESADSMDSSVFFATLSNFSQAFDRAHQDNLRWGTAKRQDATEEEDAAASGQQTPETPTPPPPPPKKVLADKGCMDELMSALQGGNAFGRRKQAAATDTATTTTTTTTDVSVGVVGSITE